MMSNYFACALCVKAGGHIARLFACRYIPPPLRVGKVKCTIP